MGGIYRLDCIFFVVAEVKGHSRSFKVIVGHQLCETKEYEISS